MHAVGRASVMDEGAEKCLAVISFNGHFDQQEQFRVSTDEIARYRSKYDKKKRFALFKIIGSKQSIFLFCKRLTW
jgi:hypothetical protein